MYEIKFLQQAELDILQLETVVILGLILITGIALLVRRIRVPYTVALVIAGLLLAVLPVSMPVITNIPEQLISSELILSLFVPPLVFEGALSIEWKKFRSNLIQILLMAVFGVLIGTIITGGLILAIVKGSSSLAETFGLPGLGNLSQIPFWAAIAFGALISATDPVAVISFFRSLGVEKRLSILIEGESLLNDGTSIVIFQIAMTLGGVVGLHQSQISSSGVIILDVIWMFCKVAIGGIIVGLAVGKVSEFVLRRTDARLVETTLTIVAAFGAYILAEYFGLSGILSVVAAGILLGNAIPKSTSPTTRLVLNNFWEILSFIATSLIFLIIGWMIDIRRFITLENLLLVTASVVAVLIARFMVVYGMSVLTNFGLPLLRRFSKLFKPDPIPSSYQRIIFWGGLRGAISLALALSIGVNTFGIGVGEQLRMMTFGVVLFTLLVQGTTIKQLIKRLGLTNTSEREIEKQRYLGHYFLSLAAKDEIKRLHENGTLSGTLWKIMEEAQQAELQRHDQDVRDMLSRYPGLSIELALQARRSILNAERSAIWQALRLDIISEDIQEEILEEIDIHIEVLEQIAEEIHSVPRLITAEDES